MKLIFSWILTCLLVYFVLDAVATRPVPVHVERFREAGMTDEQVLSQAVQHAYRLEKNVWWIHDKQPYLVFAPWRRYDIDPGHYAAFNLEIRADERQNLIGILRPALATLGTP